MDARIKQAIEEFNQERFHQAHDTLEEFWQEYRGEDRKYYQAWIQICVALYLLQENRDFGARKVLNRAIVNAQDYSKQIPNLDLAKLLKDSEEYFTNRTSYPKI